MKNGIIIDSSGYGIANDSEACSLTDAQSSSGGGGCFISSTVWAH